MKRLLLIMSFLLLTCSCLWAQETKVSGTIIDAETNEPLTGATVVVKGKLTGTSTDAEGKFELTTSMKYPFTITVSTLGYQKQEIEVTGENPVSVSLSSKAELI